MGSTCCQKMPSEAEGEFMLDHKTAAGHGDMTEQAAALCSDLENQFEKMLTEIEIPNASVKVRAAI